MYNKHGRVWLSCVYQLHKFIDMISKEKKEIVERVVLKVPTSVAKYFREEFPHGQRSQFVVSCILDYKHQQEIKKMEGYLRKAGKLRQS